jgi:DNA-directed RNA polymerase subunit RPC12/RpoP
MGTHHELIRDSWIKIIVYLLLAVALLTLPFIVLVPEARWSALIALLLTMMAGHLLLVIETHVRAGGYRCGKCGHEFQINALQDLIGPHTLAKKYVKCPQCGKRSWATVLRRR